MHFLSLGAEVQQPLQKNQNRCLVVSIPQAAVVILTQTNLSVSVEFFYPLTGVDVFEMIISFVHVVHDLLLPISVGAGLVC